MERTMMKVKRRSLSSSISKLNNSIHKMEKLYKPIVSLYNMDAAWRNLLIPDFQLLGAKLKSTILELQAVKVLVRQRKEALPKGKRYMCFTLSDWRSRIEMYESEVEGLEGILAGFAEKYMKTARELQPGTYTNNKCSDQGTKYTVTEYEDGDG